MHHSVHTKLMIYELLEKGFKTQQIIRATGKSAPTVRKYMAIYSKEEHEALKQMVSKEETPKKESERKYTMKKLTYEEILQLHDIGLNQAEIATALKVSVSTLIRFLKASEKDTGIFKTRKVRTNEEIERGAVLSLYLSGETATTIAKQLDKSISIVTSIIEKYNEMGNINSTMEEKGKATMQLTYNNAVSLGEVAIDFASQVDTMENYIDAPIDTQADTQIDTQLDTPESEDNLKNLEVAQSDKILEMTQEHDESTQLLFSTYEHICASLKQMDNLVTNMRASYSEVGAYNIEQQTILHKMEDAKTQQELLEVAQELYAVRKKRRISKIEYSLASKLMTTLKQYRTHTDALVSIANVMEETLTIFKNPEYTPVEQRDNDDEDETLPETQKTQNSYTPKDEDLADWQIKLKQISS